jgi:hypothetical protein
MLFDSGAGPVGAAGVLLCGLRVVSLDGTTSDVPDTTENAAYFGRPSNATRAGAFLQVRWLPAAESGTGSEVFALVTDLLDIQAYPALDLACAYTMRLRAETVIAITKPTWARACRQALTTPTDTVTAGFPPHERDLDPPPSHLKIINPRYVVRARPGRASPRATKKAGDFPAPNDRPSVVAVTRASNGNPGRAVPRDSVPRRRRGRQRDGAAGHPSPPC